MNRFWISWNEPGDDPRPLTVPSPDWWCTGWGDGYATVCAIIDAESEEGAKARVQEQWEPSSWRFCNEVEANWTPPADRFPPRALKETEGK